MLINELLNKYTDIVPEEEPTIVLYIKYYLCMDKNGKDTKNNRRIARRVQFVRNGENCKINKIVWCEGGPQLEEIATMNVGENDLNHGMKDTMVMHDS